MHSTTVALAALAILLAGVLVFAVRARMRSPGKRSTVPVHRASLLVGDTQRSFVYCAPPSISPGAPLLIVFHGGSGSSEQIRNYTGFAFDELAEAHGFAVAYPQGIGGNWNTCQKGRKNAATQACGKTRMGKRHGRASRAVHDPWRRALDSATTLHLPAHLWTNQHRDRRAA